MAMNKVLMNAILAMDSYNRGYEPGIEITGSAVGNATFIKDSESLGKIDAETRKDENIGFYGIAYKYDGETVISYRGTDNLVNIPLVGETIGSDTWNGYAGGAGAAYSNQAEMAFAFYREVAGVSNNPYNANISLTGHSLGGGLAGLVAATYDKQADLFNNMDFDGSATRLQDLIVHTPKMTDVHGNLIDTDLYEPILKEKIVGAAMVKDVDFSNLTTHYMKGEFLAINRDDPVRRSAHTIGSDVDLPGVDNGSLGGGLHSMSTLVMQIYADDLSDKSYAAAAKYFWPVLYDKAFAERIGMNQAGNSNAADDLRAMIAYSAIDEGTRVFGDTAIRALYDDANNFGKAIAASAVPTPSVALHGNSIAQALVEYAGILALKKIEQKDFTTAIDGVVNYTSTAGKFITLNFDSALWTKANKGTAPSIIASRDDIANYVLKTVDGNTNAIETVMGKLWGTNTAVAFDRVFYGVEGGSITLSEKATGSTKANLYIGHSAADNVTGTSGNDLLWGGLDLYPANDVAVYKGGAGKDIIISSFGKSTLDGGIGDDYLYGSNAADTLLGGDNNDTLIGGLGNDALDGGAGRDVADYSAVTGAGLSVIMNGTNGTVAVGAAMGVVTGGTEADTLTSIEVIKGTAQADYFRGGSGKVVFEGGAGPRDLLRSNWSQINKHARVKGLTVLKKPVLEAVRKPANDNGLWRYKKVV